MKSICVTINEELTIIAIDKIVAIHPGFYGRAIAIRTIDGHTNTVIISNHDNRYLINNAIIKLINDINNMQDDDSVITIDDNWVKRISRM